MENKDKKIVTLLMVFSVIFTVMGSTLAYWNWETTEGELTGVTFTVTSEFSCSADGGDELNSNSVMLAPTTCDNETYAIKREITLDRTMTVEGMKIYTDLWLDVKILDTGLKNSENFKWVFTTDENSCNEDNAISYGTFTGLVTNDKVMLLDSEMYSDTEEDTYYLYIWLDKAETSTSTMDQEFEFKINGECSDINTKLEAPVLDDGLIPVTIDNDGTVTTISSTDNSWYNYDNKAWANAVLVRENADASDSESHTRTYYQENISNEVEVHDKDILAYFVWIPRYSYKIWTTGVSDGTPQLIDISWERADDRYLEGTQIDEYRTHPAFWWDTDGDRLIDKRETVAGIWVGKFETTGDETTPTVLPNVVPLTNQTVSNQFKNALLFSGGILTNNIVTYPENDTTYGLNGELESHMMKNSEWGAVAYLSHSVYGIGEEVRYNNYYSSGMKTGCGAVTSETTSASMSCDNAYASDINTYPQSTTGNIFGIFDMSGGVYEYVMGNYANRTYLSGFDVTWFTQTSNQKYYDLYPSDVFAGTELTNVTFCTIKNCGGHGLFETKSWYDDFANFIYPDYPWFNRGGIISYSSGSGIFSFLRNSGAADSNYGFRTVLTPKSIGELQ